MSKGWRRGYRAASATGPTLRCARCGEAKPIDAFRLLRHGSRASYCNPCQVHQTREWRERHRDAILTKRRDQYRESPTYTRKPPRTGACERCGSAFVTTQDTRRFCTRSCAHVWRHDQSGRPGKHVRVKILDRDGWRCYLCGGDIDRSLTYPHVRSGTVDHLVPVSAGGTHDASNLYAAHWGCNDAKGDRLPTWWERQQAAVVAA